MPDAVINLNPAVIFAVVGFLFFLTLFGMGAVTVAVMRPRIRLRRRMAAFGLVGGGAGAAAALNNPRQKRIQEKLQELEDKKKSTQSRRNQIRADLLQAGIDMKVSKFLVITAFSGVMAASLYVIAGFPLMFGLAPIGAGLFGAFLLPKFVLRFIARKRQKLFTKEFANALDVITRGIKSGLPVSECMAVIARESPDPVGEEFRLMIDGERVGLTLEDVMRRGLERMPTSDFKFFSIVLQIQRQTGGNLADTLENLSTVLRLRKKMKDKARAMSSEAKASASIIGSLPFFVGGMVSLINPDYIMLLFTTYPGKVMLGIGAATMATGILVMSKMINIEI